MIFETHTLKSPLDQFVESIFYYKDFKPDHSIERVVPTGHMFIIFESDGISRNTFDNETLTVNGTFSKVWVSGMHKNYLSISAHLNSEMFIIQFKPLGAYPFFHAPIHQFNDRVIAAQDIFGNEILKLQKLISEDIAAAEKFRIAEGWLLGRLDSKRLPNKELLLTANYLTNNPFSDHNAIINIYPKTQKHLINQFKKFCGLTPKVFHRIIRFNEILKVINKKQKISWTQIAYHYGYTDQSHFIKEFKEFSGFNPQEFIKEGMNKEETNFFPLDKEG